MFFTRGAMHISQLSKKRGGIRIEDKAIEGCILLPASCLCCCGLDVNQSIMLTHAQKDCVIKMSKTEDISGGIEFLSRGLVI